MRINSYANDVVGKTDQFLGVDENGNTRNFLAEATKNYVAQSSGSYDMYTEVNISASQLRQSANSSIQLLPPVINRYYEYKVVLEFTAGNQLFDTVGNVYSDIIYISNSVDYASIDSPVSLSQVICMSFGTLTEGQKVAFTVSNVTDGVEAVTETAITANQGVYLFAQNLFTQGTGTILAKVFYTEKAFGSLL